jgi:hypothetical protein
LPFVPCRIIPRNVVMQERQRVDPASGEVEHYMKPRITNDLSHADADSVNAGVHALDRAIALPTNRPMDAIYARTSMRSQLQASAAVGDVRGPEIERAVPGWAQPVTR